MVYLLSHKAKKSFTSNNVEAFQPIHFRPSGALAVFEIKREAVPGAGNFGIPN
tara:strand:+ start:3409 stop:3567 length:159 start_codon:yes stop_codon:yes gene_type:complete